MKDKQSQRIFSENEKLDHNPITYLCDYLGYRIQKIHCKHCYNKYREKWSLCKIHLEQITAEMKTKKFYGYSLKELVSKIHTRTKKPVTSFYLDKEVSYIPLIKAENKTEITPFYPCITYFKDTKQTILTFNMIFKSKNGYLNPGGNQDFYTEQGIILKNLPDMRTLTEDNILDFLLLLRREFIDIIHNEYKNCEKFVSHFLQKIANYIN